MDSSSCFVDRHEGVSFSELTMSCFEEKRDEWETLNRSWKLIIKEVRRYGIMYGITNTCVQDQPPYLCHSLPAFTAECKFRGILRPIFVCLVFLYCFIIMMHLLQMRSQVIFLCCWRIFLCSEGFYFFLTWYIRNFHLVGKRNLTYCFK